MDAQNSNSTDSSVNQTINRDVDSPENNNEIEELKRKKIMEKIINGELSYRNINWLKGFENWKLVRFFTPMDGSCLFHAICNSFFLPYRTGILRDKPISKKEIVASLRKELSIKLTEKINNNENAPTHYQTLNGGNTAVFAESVPEFSLQNMQSTLDSDEYIGYGYLEFISNAINKDIYILSALHTDIYVTDELPLTIKGNRKSIIVYYSEGHYELVGLVNDDSTEVDTHFNYDHSLIKFLYNRVQSLIK